ncbi:hypothetical protein A2U01_0024385, partial [Trifolium medium]|nr:hypothetical protein [Trifolium medium]
MKVKIFSWQLMLHRLPTRANLLRRGVLESSAQVQCAWCSAEVESEAHLFTRNSLIFQGVKLKTCEIVDAIKYRSLHWFVASRYGGACVLYEWEKLPLNCLL